MLPVRAVLRTGVAVKAFRVYLRAATSCPKLQALPCLWLISDAAANVTVCFTCIFHLLVTRATNAERKWVPFFRNVTGEDPETPQTWSLWIHQCSSQSPPSRSIPGERSSEVPSQKQQGKKKGNDWYLKITQKAWTMNWREMPEENQTQLGIQEGMTNYRCFLQVWVGESDVTAGVSMNVSAGASQQWHCFSTAEKRNTSSSGMHPQIVTSLCTMKLSVKKALLFPFLMITQPP